MKKYNTKKEKTSIGTMFRITAVRSFGNVKKGDKGGLIEKDSNLSHYGDAWVYGDARVSCNARVFDDAWVSCNARVSGDARVFGGFIK